MLPHVVVHNEISLDARLDGLHVDMGRFYGLARTWSEDCTLVGADTLLAAMPGLADVAPPPTPSASDASSGEGGGEASADAPLIAVVDSRGRLPGIARLRDQPYWRDVVTLCSDSTPQSHMWRLARAGVTSISCGEDRVDLRCALEALADREGVRTVRVDAGGSLVGALLRGGLVREVSVVVEPRLVGGETHRWLVRAPDAAAGDVVRLKLRSLERFDDDALWLRYDVVDD